MGKGWAEVGDAEDQVSSMSVQCSSSNSKSSSSSVPIWLSQTRSPHSTEFLQLPRGVVGMRQSGSQASSRPGPGCQDEDSAAPGLDLDHWAPSSQSYTRLAEGCWTHPGHWPSSGRSCPGSSCRNSSARQITCALREQPGWGQHRGPSSSCQRWQAGKRENRE
uniref:Structure-specific endonuclease subunit SLX1 n=1 Tax=Sus scrofa TaxID=9823 RepID=A0A480H4A6_PIG